MSDKTKPVLSVHDLGVRVDDFSLLKGVEFDLSVGQILVILGPNGAGKSTLVRALSGEKESHTGQARFCGRPLDDINPRTLAQRRAVLLQGSELNFPFSVREVVELARMPHETGIERDTHIVNEVLAYLDVEYLADRLYPVLSGGERQRVQLARILAQIWEAPMEGVQGKEEADKGLDQRLLILDEPAANFDLSHQQLLVQTVRDMASQGIAVVLVLHDLNMACDLADQILLLSCGRVAAHGATEKVLTEENIQSVFGVKCKILQDQDTSERYFRVQEK